MGGVNLARRPFVNRRPVLRLAVLLWLIGAALLLVNVRLYSQHLKGSGDYRQQLVDVDREVREAEEKLTEQDHHLARINLGSQNRHTEFLNSLIEYRRFPWSALFDDLEEVLPRDVRLNSVTPAVRLKTDEVKKKRRQPIRGRRPREETPAEVEEQEQAAPPPDAPRSNEVSLQVTGVARTEEALLEFIDILYASPSFRNPFLPGEIILDEGVSFSIGVLYLTRPNQPAEETLAAPERSEDAIEDEESGDESTEGGLVASQGESGDGEDAGPGVADTDLPEQAASTETGPRSARPSPDAATTSEKESRPALPGETSQPGETPSKRRRSGATSRLPGESRPTSRRSLGAVPTAGASTGTASEAPSGAETPPPADQPPGTVEPPASATPTLRRGSLPGGPITILTTTWGALA